MRTRDELQLKEVNKACDVLKGGGVVIFPTDTVYGIGCRFDKKQAIDRIFKIKGTPKTQHFPVLVSSARQVKDYALIGKAASTFIRKHWPGGLTLILNANDGRKVGFRMPDSELVKSIVEKIGVPIVGTSANFHGRLAPKSFRELDKDFIKLADFVIKGECQKKTESTVVDATVNPPQVLRQGAVRVN